LKRVTTPIKRVVNALVHESARDDELTVARHEAFILSHLGGGAIALVAAVAYRVVAGTPDPFVLVVFAWLVAPASLALVLSRTGSLASCHLLSAASLAGLVGSVAAVTGGISSFAIAWIIAVPAEAALSGSRRVVSASIAMCIATLAAVFAVEYWQAVPVLYRFDDIALVPAIGIISALGYVGGLAMSAQELHSLATGVIRRSEERYRLLAEDVSDLITRHDAIGSVIDVSGAVRGLLGCDGPAVLGGGFLDFVHLADRPSVLTALTGTARTGKPATVEFRLAYLGRGGATRRGYRWVELRCRRPDRSGHDAAPWEVVAVTRDITASKAQQLVVLEARDEAERANTAKTHFLAKISHELRTPLNAIIGFSEILQEELGDLAGHERRFEYAGLIHESGSHLLAVVNDLMDMSRLEVGALDISPRPFALHETLEICAQVMGPIADREQVELVCDLPAGEIEIVADPRACRQIVLNLLSNALKFTPPHGRVTLGTATDGDMVEIFVADTGVGIPPEALSSIGNPFFQVDNGLDRKHEGAGLGLSVVKGLVELHGGATRIESRVGEGTRVTVRMPRTTPAQNQPGDAGDGGEGLRCIA
jgi:cell cycle sensor histidine kinase DivJ